MTVSFLCFEAVSRLFFLSGGSAELCRKGWNHCVYMSTVTRHVKQASNRNQWRKERKGKRMNLCSWNKIPSFVEAKETQPGPAGKQMLVLGLWRNECTPPPIMTALFSLSGYKPRLQKAESCKKKEKRRNINTIKLKALNCSCKA